MSKSKKKTSKAKASRKPSPARKPIMDADFKQLLTGVEAVSSKLLDLKAQCDALGSMLQYLADRDSKFDRELQVKVEEKMPGLLDDKEAVPSKGT